MNAPALASPAALVTLENVLDFSAKLLEELSSLQRAASRIESVLTGYPFPPAAEQQTTPQPAGLISGLHENLCDLSQRISGLSSVLSNIEDRLAAPKVVNPAPFPPSVPLDLARYGGPTQVVFKR